MMMVAFLMAGWAIQVDLRRRGMNEDYAADTRVRGGDRGIVGAKIWYVLLTGEWGRPVFGAAGSYGTAGSSGGWPRSSARLVATSARALVDGAHRRAPGARLRARTRRLLLVNDDYGIPSTLPWAMKFPEGLPPTTWVS